jgi:hypothetical protein
MVRHLFRVMKHWPRGGVFDETFVHRDSFGHTQFSELALSV